MKKRGMTRREFLAGAAAAGGMIVIGDRLIKGRTRYASASRPADKIRVAVVGLGRQGQLLLKSFMKVPGVEIAALCDVDEGALNKVRAQVETTRGQRLPRLVSDVRRVLDDSSIDAISIATPNHWHALMGVWACQAGKDCYIESPCSHSFFEGKQLVAATQQYQRIIQYGSLGQISSLSGFDQSTIYCLGAIHSVRTICFSNRVQVNNARPSFKKSRDFDLWLGPARIEKPDGIEPNWRKLPQMHNGALGFFALDDLHRNLRLLGPDLPTKVSTLSSGKSASVIRGACIAVQMEFGNDGTGASKRLDLEVLPKRAMPREIEQFLAARKASHKSAYSGVVSETTIKGSGGSLTYINSPDSSDETSYLVENFVEAVRERKQELLASPIERAHVTCGSLHLANISLVLKRPLAFNPSTQSSINDAQVDELLLGFHRAPYTLPTKI